MKKDIVNSIEKLRPKSQNYIDNIQLNNLPHYFNMRLERRYEFFVHGVDHSFYREDSLLFVTNDIPFTPNQKKHIFSDSLKNLVDNNLCLPFILFIDGKAIPLSKIMIIKDCKYSYIYINEINIETEDIKCIMFYKGVKYTENTMSSGKTIMSFNEEGLLVNEEGMEVSMNIEAVDSKIYHETLSLQHGVIQKHKIPNGYRAVNDCLIHFKDGLLIDNSTYIDHGYNSFSLLNNLFYDSKVVTKVFCYVDGNVEVNNSSIVDKTTIGTVTEPLNKLYNPFNLNFSRHKEYGVNVTDALFNIMDYNSGLMNDVYANRSNIISKTYSGSGLKKLVNDKGYITMSRRIGESLDNFVMMFVNGELFKYHHELVYKNKNFIFPFLEIADDDVVEFLFFKNVNLNEYKIRFDYDSEGDLYFYSEDIDMSEMKLFTMDVEKREFNIEIRDDIQYQLEYIHERLESGKIRIYPKEPYYYNKDLTLVSDRRFNYQHFFVKKDAIKFKLPREFRFCNDFDKYMVFYNGRKLDKANYKVTIPKHTRPFTDIAVYINMDTKPGDKIEVFYLPEVINELATKESIPTEGKVILDRNRLRYNLSRDLHLFFVNGKKVHREQLKDISSTRVKLVEDVKSVDNLSIISHIPEDKVLVDLFLGNGSNLDSIINSMTDAEYLEIFGSTGISKEELDLFEGSFPMKHVMYDIIHDYYMRPFINNGDDFVFDFDCDEFDEFDSEGNVLLYNLDASLEDKIE